jgi:hypothetical protein
MRGDLPQLLHDQCKLEQLSGARVRAVQKAEENHYDVPAIVAQCTRHALCIDELESG